MRKRDRCSPFVYRFDHRWRPSVLLPRPSGLELGSSTYRPVRLRGRAPISRARARICTVSLRNLVRYAG